MRTQRQVVDYALQRRALLAEVHSGRVGVAEVCDASPYLLRAARFHGEPSDADLPGLPQGAADPGLVGLRRRARHAAGSARATEEIERLANLHAEFSVYVVEVCRTCSWNHLVLSYVMGTGDAPETAGRPAPTPDRRRVTADRRPRTPGER